MKDLCLKFADKTEMEQWLKVAGFQKDEFDGLFCEGVCLDVIGVITDQVGEGEDATYEVVDGYHANLRVVDESLDLSALDKFVVTPKTPARVWA